MKRWGWLLLACAGIWSVSAAAAAELKPFKRGSHAQILAAQGEQPFIVTFWSVNCTYCSGELAMLRKVLARHREIGLVLVSTDTPADEPLIDAALAKQGLAEYASWVFADTHVERLRYEIDREWYGELPRTYFHSARTGSWAASGQLEQAAVEAWIEQQSQKP